MLNLLKQKYTKCDSGETLNWLMHPFLFLTLFLSVGLLWFHDTKSVQSLILYQRTMKIDDSLVSLWGVIGLIVMVLHTVAFWVRGKVGARLMQATVFGGFYLWLWASVIYITGDYWFQFLVLCLPNLYFWSWYTLQWRRRARGERVAFV